MNLGYIAWKYCGGEYFYACICLFIHFIFERHARKHLSVYSYSFYEISMWKRQTCIDTIINGPNLFQHCSNFFVRLVNKHLSTCFLTVLMDVNVKHLDSCVYVIVFLKVAMSVFCLRIFKPQWKNSTWSKKCWMIQDNFKLKLTMFVNRRVIYCIVFLSLNLFFIQGMTLSFMLGLLLFRSVRLLWLKKEICDCTWEIISVGEKLIMRIFPFSIF